MWSAGPRAHARNQQGVANPEGETPGGSGVSRRRVVAVIPAHNEAASITATIRGLQSQTRPVDQIVVVADNCTDDTEQIAASAGAQVWSTEHNSDKKAGALNQVLSALLPNLDASDCILAVDADSVPDPGFVEAALTALADGSVGAVGGIFHGRRGAGLLGKLQRMEYTRYARDINRSNRVWVLTGTATMHRVDVLEKVAEARGRHLHGYRGDVYDRTALTEDMEITLAVKLLGYRCVSPASCGVVTEVMPTVGDLWRQRLRWQRGALENLHAYGVNLTTVPYLGQQALMMLSIVALWLYVGLTVATAVTGTLTFSPTWSAIGLIFVAERVITVWKGGPLARWIGGVLIIEMVYALFLQAVFLAAAAAALSRSEAVWHHVEAIERN